MFKVECPGCQAPYQVDERRVPASGLKMRCPKCAHSFDVRKPADGPPTGPIPVFGAPAPTASSKPRPPRPPPRPASLKGTMIGVAPGAAAPPRPAPPKDEPELPSPTVRAVPAGSKPSPVPLEDLDLPAPVLGHGAPRGGKSGTERVERSREVPSAAADDLGLDLDLPAVSGALPEAPVDLPAAAGQRSAPPRTLGFGDLDLPSPGGRSASRAPLQPAAPPSTADFELELDQLPTVRGPGAKKDPPRHDALDLPSPAGAALAGEDLDEGIALPSLPPPESALPIVRSNPDLPSPSAELPSRSAELPSPSAQLPSPAAALPSPAAELPLVTQPLPSVRRPAPAPDAFGELELPMGDAAAELDLDAVEPFERPPPSSRGKDFGALASGGSLPPNLGTLPPPPGGTLPPPPAPSSGPSVPAFSLPPAGGIVRQAGGGTSFGEVDLEGSEAALPVDTAAPATADEDMEFGAIPQERGGSSQRPRVAAVGRAATEAPVAARGAPAEPSAPGSGKRKLKVAAAAIVFGVVGGGALSLVPAIGPFGVYFITDRFKADEYAALLNETVGKARRELGPDTYVAAKRALAGVDRAQAQAKRVPALRAYSALLVYLFELRFGTEPDVFARGQVIVDELADQEGVAYLDLARAARAVVDGQLARGRQLVNAVLASDGSHPEALLLRAEIETRARNGKAAVEAWQKLLARHPGARAKFGLARAHYLQGDAAAAERAATDVIGQNAEHVAAKILLAQIAWNHHHREKQAVELLEQVLAAAKAASPEERVEAQTLLGDIHLSRSRISLAEAAYDEALSVDPKASRALAGLGDVLYRAGRYSEALARFEAAAQANADDTAAKIGVAKSKIALERIGEASQVLKKLREAQPTSAVVNYWFGRAQEAQGDRDAAETAYRAAIEQGGSDPQVVEPYLALALVLGARGKAEEAGRLLEQARQKLPNTPAIHRALGDLASSQGRYAEAIEQYEQAVELDAEDVASHFRLGVAERRNRDFERAGKQFDKVASLDPEYPGLALERGLLFEAAGQAEQALKAYEGALAKAPDDPDLMLRVGCGKVSAGRAEQAIELLRKVLSQKPNSAESHHCLGRALLLEGRNLAEALRFLERAVELDPHRAEHHLYVGWAANEAGRVAVADKALEEALKLDQGLGDAYWQRGVLRYRQGAVKDALADLQRALELRPSRFEAHATMADTLEDLGREPEALAAWAKAVAAQPDNATWRFRFGKLLLHNRKAPEARAQLERCVQIAEASHPSPRWLVEAHYNLARAIGLHRDAIPHWKAFLKLSPSDSPYRSEALTALEKLGEPWDG